MEGQRNAEAHPISGIYDPAQKEAQMSDNIRYVPPTVVIGPQGQHCLTRGYTEIAGKKFYDDRIVVGPDGQYVLQRGGADE